MKLKKILAISSAAILMVGAGLSIGIAIGLNNDNPPIVDSGFEASTGVKVTWDSLITNNVVNVEDLRLGLSLRIPLPVLP